MTFITITFLIFDAVLLAIFKPDILLDSIALGILIYLAIKLYEIEKRGE